MVSQPRQVCIGQRPAGDRGVGPTRWAPRPRTRSALRAAVRIILRRSRPSQDNWTQHHDQHNHEGNQPRDVNSADLRRTRHDKSVPHTDKAPSGRARTNRRCQGIAPQPTSIKRWPAIGALDQQSTTREYEVPHSGGPEPCSTVGDGNLGDAENDRACRCGRGRLASYLRWSGWRRAGPRRSGRRGSSWRMADRRMRGPNC